MGGGLVAEQIASFRADFDGLRREVARTVVGQAEAVDVALMALLAGGHVLLDGVPGVGKTVLATSLAQAAGLSLQRLPFTPDLMPADIIGTYVVMETPQGRRTFEFQQGPLFTHVVLADHINRGTPKTQSALLEAMEGPTVSVAAEKFPLPQPFFVVATQNPLDMEGTFPLPEAQLDRFLFQASLTLPSVDELEQILARTTGEGLAPLRAAIDGRRVLEMRSVVRQTPIAAEAQRYAIALTVATQPDHDRAPPSVRRYVRYGASPRAAQAMILGAKVRALAEGRAQATGADVKRTAHAALRHRLILGFEGQAEDARPNEIVDELLQTIVSP